MAIQFFADSDVKPKRFKDPPPADMKPDPDYVPEVGKWFWWDSSGKWELRYRKNENDIQCLEYGSLREKRCGEMDDCVAGENIYLGNSLPATAPE